ncbi:RXT2-like protein [Xylaria nigripes]|nr:RXT2-like protein [Xylaria nigripes]
MASQHVIFAETIAAMKKARKRRAYESDSDSEVDYHGNRGRKMKRKARFAHEGQAAPPSGPEVYREVVNHAGYQRTIISRNPPLIDDEGYEVDSDDDEEHILDAINNAAEFNPYANIRLESVYFRGWASNIYVANQKIPIDILAPLTAVTDLPTHPTLSRPYTSTTLTELAKQGCNIMHKENAALWKIKHLQTKLIGDHDWAPCELMIGPNDIELFNDEHIDRLRGPVRSNGSMPILGHAPSDETSNGYSASNGGGRSTNIHATQHELSNNEEPDSLMADAITPPHEAMRAHISHYNGVRNIDRTLPHDHTNNEDNSSANKEVDALLQASGRAGIRGGAHALDSLTTNGPVTNGLTVPGNPARTDVTNASLSNEAARRPINDISRPASIMSDSTTDLPIHPMFIAPRSARPDRDFGMLESEAEEIRRLLQLYVQKQEEVCRGVKRLYEGLLRADRMRKTVFQWSKYEAHVGQNRDMSDGEDWYDKSEWGLEEDLKKGQDEEEDEAPQTTKKTRTRR